MDLMSDSLTSGRRLRILNIMDDCNRESLVNEAYYSIPAQKLVVRLKELINERDKPKTIQTLNSRSWPELLLLYLFDIFKEKKELTIMKKQILLLEKLGIPEADVKEKAKDLDYELIWSSSEANAEAVEIIVTIKKEADREIIEKYTNLKMIAVAFTGYDAVDMDVCQEKNIAVYNVPAYATNSVAELAVGLGISLLREIPKSDQLVKNKKWNLKPGLDCYGFCA